MAAKRVDVAGYGWLMMLMMEYDGYVCVLRGLRLMPLVEEQVEFLDW